jgi:hypothetical protein
LRVLSAFRSRSLPKSTALTKPIFTIRLPRCCSNPVVEFLGEINERSKSEFLGEALALLAPIDWPQPFGSIANAETWLTYMVGAVGVISTYVSFRQLQTCHRMSLCVRIVNARPSIAVTLASTLYFAVKLELR